MIFPLKQILENKIGKSIVDLSAVNILNYTIINISKYIALYFSAYNKKGLMVKLYADILINF